MNSSKPSGVLYRQLASLLSGPLACLIVLWLPPPEGLSPQGMKCMAAALWVILWWMTGVFPIALTSIFSIVIFGAMGVLPPVAGFAMLGSPTIMLLLGAMILLGVWKESSLIERYAYWAINLPLVAGRPKRLLAVFGFATGFLSMLVPNIPVAILFTSIAVAMAKGTQAQPGHPLYRALCLSAGVGSALGGAGTPIGGAPNLVVLGVIATSLNYQMEFWQWTAIGLPMALLWLLVMIVLCHFFFPLRDDASIPTEIVKEQMKKLGPVSRHEHIAMMSMITALLLWSFAQPLAGALDMPGLKKLMGAPFVALLVGTALFFIPLKRSESGNIVFAMSWQQGLRAVNWDVIIFVAGALVFGEMLIKGGVDKWLAQLIGGMLNGMPGMAVWLVLMMMTGLVSQCFSNVAVISLLLPVTASLSAQFGLNPIVTCLTVGMVANIGIMFPFSSPPTAVTLITSEGYVTAKDFFRFSFVMIAVAAGIAILVGTVLGPLVFPMPAGN